MKRNNLDKLYQEQFKDFAPPPNPEVWQRIEASLNEKKNRRIIPIWWRFGGIAAILILGLLTFSLFFSKENQPSIEQKVTTTTTKKATEPTKTVNASENNDALVTSNPNSNENEANAITTHTTTKAINRNRTSAENPLLKSTSAVVSNKTQKNKDGFKANEAAISNELPNKTNADIVATNNNPEASNTDNTVSEQNKTNGILFDDSRIAQNKAVKDTLVNHQKKSIFEAIEESEEVVQQNDDEIKKWSLGPSVAPVYFDAIGQGSPIHSTFNSNSKSGNLNLSYGLTVAYQVSKKISLRSGVHKVDYGYDTKDVSFSSSLSALNNGQIENIDYSQSARTIVVSSAKERTAAFSDNAEIANTVAPLSGRMVQQLGYIEVPMELNYRLLDHKFGINVIGGVSSLFLLDNAVSLESNELVTEMGAANNVNDVSFSTNIGLGLDYKINNALKINLEPMFKYQLNTFNNTSGEFRPYTIGVYSGLRFQF